MSPPLALLPLLPPQVALALALGAPAPMPATADAPLPAAVADAPTQAPAGPVKSPFSRMFAIAGYGTSWAGSYAGAGAGGRLRIEPWERLGLDLFTEALMVQTPHGLRHDHPFGFNVYVPFRFAEEWRIRPLLGMCFVASFIEPETKGAPRADDLLVGAHAGVGLERAMGSYFSAFVEVQGSGWMGHDRAVQGWTGAVGNEMKGYGVAQAMLGVSAHLGSK